MYIYLTSFRGKKTTTEPMVIQPIYTEHFVLTKMTASDGDKYYRLSNNENVMKYVTGYSLTREESDRMLAGFLEEHGMDTYLGRYLIEDRHSGELIGAAKLDKIGAAIEIGYRIMEEFWGRGVGTEIATGLIRFAKNVLNATDVIAFVNVDNAASIRVLEKAGMTNTERIEDLDEVKYRFNYSPKSISSMKKVLYILLGLIALFLIAAFIMPKDYAVEREIVVNKPKAEVFEYLKSLRKQNDWSVWGLRDPNMQKTFSGTDGTVGFVSMWEGNDEVGKGEQEITKIEEGQRIDTELRFLKPFESTSDAYMITEAVNSTSTKVRWGFTGRMPIPMNVMLPFMNMEESIGKDFQEGLTNLKGILEKRNPETIVN
ncbi:GNAT family N-acetyltransferase [Dyadobacter sp. CY261]|uniref:GNAT family N-acetyltransferase n=1 Tax=Dyadobacter sp. CY261 TaxID=2907203 RepID=UPI001F161C9A|nr:GNAT family N-acetyltransferase [Dyadobacter sp. CY261]MCF0074541.1 GNAT family N-acetyltransferase [Dyadobacter sp. CY261]